MSARPLAIIAGAGSLPAEVAAVASLAGPVTILPIRGYGPRAGGGHVGEAISLFDPAGAIAALRRLEPSAVMLAGSVSKPGFAAMADGWQAVKHRDEIRSILEGGDDNVLRGAVRFLEQNGFVVVGVADVAPGLMGAAGSIAGRTPSPAALRDVAVGHALLAAISPYDVGQGVVVSGNRILAVEAVEGTDALLRRVATLRQPGLRGRLARRGRPPVAELAGGVLVKAPKRGQDRRVDQPAIGPNTVRLAAAAGLDGIAVEAGEVLILDRERTVALAGASGLFVWGSTA